MGTTLSAGLEHGSVVRDGNRAELGTTAPGAVAHTLRTHRPAAGTRVHTVESVTNETAAPTIGVVELPDLAEALDALGINVVTGEDMRSAVKAIKTAFASGRFPLVSADVLKGALKMWLATAIKTSGMEVVLVHTEAPVMQLDGVESLQADSSLATLFAQLGLEAPAGAVDYTCAGRSLVVEEPAPAENSELPDFEDFDDEDEETPAAEENDGFYDDEDENSDQGEPAAEAAEETQDEDDAEDDGFYDDEVEEDAADDEDSDEAEGDEPVAAGFDPAVIQAEWEEEDGARIDDELPSDDAPVLASDMLDEPTGMQMAEAAAAGRLHQELHPTGPNTSWLAAPARSIGNAGGVFSDYHSTQNFRRGRGYSGEGTVIFAAAGKGGVGKTTTAQQLAAEASRSDLTVVLVDANSGQGDQRQKLGLKDHGNLPSVLDAAVTGQPSAAVITAEQMNSLRPGGAAELYFDLICAPPTELEEEGTVPPELYANILTWCKSTYDITIVDTQIIEANDQTGYYKRMILPMLYGESGWAVGVTDMDSAGMQNLRERFARMIRDEVPKGRLLSIFNGVEDVYLNLAGSTEFQGWMEEVSRFMGMVPWHEGLKTTMNRNDVGEPTAAMTVVYAGILFTITNNPFFQTRYNEATEALSYEEAGFDEDLEVRPKRRRLLAGLLGRGA